ncbi:MAG: peptidoglycan D,D-transpeptidase FtsI family protein [Thermodesulforhabdaceae bacterium]|jgi:cell division protein FtsI (penicillin-binding protein 3)
MFIKRLKSDKERSRFDFVLHCLSIFVLCGLVTVLIRAFQFQIIERENWRARYEAQIYADLTTNISRRPIVDRNGRPLALSVEESSLFVNPKLIANPEAVATALGPIIGSPPSEILHRMRKSGKFVVLKRFISDQQAHRIRQLGIDGLYLVRETKRFYPERWLAGQVLGFVGMDGVGLEGVEKYYDDFLRTPGEKVRFLRDGLVRTLWLSDELPSPGNHDEALVLTIDAYIQYITEKELMAAAEKYQAESAQAIVMNAKTFEILALANWPFFDPNLYQLSNPKIWKNRAIVDTFEPGSTFKAILAAALLEEKMVKPTDRMFCENGSFKVPGHLIRDVHPHGWLDFTQVIQVSSNICSAKLALNFGARRYAAYIEKFGFGRETGVDLPGEASGLVRPWEKWRPLDLATAAFGQGISVNLLQLARAFGAIANDGAMGVPRIVKKQEDPVASSEIKQASYNSPDKASNGQYQQILSPATAKTLRRILKKVTEEGGTAVSAHTPGYEVGGKTGTAQKLDPETGRYSKRDYASIFVGFAPVEDPEIVIAIVVHNPRGATYGGVVAGPVFREIALRVLPYLGVPPQQQQPIQGASMKKSGDV